MSLDENLNTHNHHPDYLRPSLPSDFLPPISRWITLGGVFLFGTVATLLAVVTFTPYRVTIEAPARIRPQGETKIVQSTAVGKVKTIQVIDHQVLKKGDILLVIDDSQLLIDQNQLQSTIASDKLKIAHANKQIKALEQKITAEKNRLDTMLTAAEVELSRQQRRYRERQIITTAEAEEVAAALKLAQEEYRRYQQLEETGAISLLQLKEKEAAWQTAIARRKKVRAALNPSPADIDIAQQQIGQTKATGKATLASLTAEQEQLKQQQAELTNNLFLSQKELAQVGIQLENTIIRSPVAGKLQKLYVGDRDRVVKLGETIAEIVPQEQPLEVKAWVASADISKLAVGQKALIKLTACPYPDYGTLPGSIHSVSPDSLEYQDPAGNVIQSRFEVTIKPENLILRSSTKECTVQAGMEGQAEILTHQETILMFLLRKARLLTDI